MSEPTPPSPQYPTDRPWERGGGDYQPPGSGGPDMKAVGLGVLMMVGAVVWFVVGMMAGRIFIYPPILFILGLVSMFKGLMNRG